ncbi:MAG TPA: heme exporter protein CcmD [Casimicrobiaceae bacterium]|nr:heme exporter protein CcmD [Casimicrobiaceae bacterium]
MTDFFAMGGYAWYVWMAYGAVALAIGVEIVVVRARRRRAFEQLRMSVNETAGSPSMMRAERSR